jgi:probable F420-dependent oxidoreductase
MRVGVVYPQTELGGDAGAVRAYGRRVEELGYTHVPAYDHVVGADPEVYTDWNGPYDINTTFHEPMVMFGYLAAITTSLELVTGVIILPQRQAVPVAKQATEVDLLSGGRLRLGVGVGWNPVEYEALGEDFHSRGKRCEEQVELMRTLWTQQSVTYHGTFHRVTGAGWHRCRSNGRSPCGSARNRHRPTDAPDASVTAGSRVTRSSRAPSSTRPVGSCWTRPQKRAETRQASAWTDASTGAVTPKKWPGGCRVGPTREPPTSRSTPWEQA